MTDANRTKPRVSIVLTPEAHAMGVEQAKARGLSFSSWLEQLIRKEAERERKAKR